MLDLLQPLQFLDEVFAHLAVAKAAHLDSLERLPSLLPQRVLVTWPLFFWLVRCIVQIEEVLGHFFSFLEPFDEVLLFDFEFTQNLILILLVLYTQLFQWAGEERIITVQSGRASSPKRRARESGLARIQAWVLCLPLSKEFGWHMLVLDLALLPLLLCDLSHLSLP